jgi:DNA-binding LacI/PurR family transcriptional regulator
MTPRESSNPKYIQIARQLREELFSKYVTGDYLPSVRALSQRFEVTVSTIRMALEELQNEGLVQTFPYRGTVVLLKEMPSRLPGIGELKSNAEQSAMAALGLHDSKTIALVMPLSPYLVASLARVAERELRQRGYRLQLCGSYIQPDSMDNHAQEMEYERTILESLTQDHVAGVLWWSVFGHKNRDAVQKLQMRGIPVLLLDHLVPHLTCDWVGIDDYGAASQATQHLLDLGHKDILFCGFKIGDYVPYTIGERLTGFLETFQMATAPAEALQTPYPISQSGISEEELVKSLAPQMKKRVFFFGPTTDNDIIDAMLNRSPRATAAVVAVDQSAVDMAVELKRRGIRIPEDMAIVTFGDTGHYTGQVTQITTIHQPFDMMARRAVRLMLLRIHDPGKPVLHVHLPTRLIIRQSSVADAHEEPEKQSSIPLMGMLG